MAKTYKGRQAPLKISIKNGAFTVSIGVETLAWAWEHSEDCQDFDDDKNKYMQKYQVTDPDGFANDVKREFEREEEDGNTELYKFFDRMCMNAMEDGSAYIDELSGVPADERPFDERAKKWAK
jgi:hypothetical protein